MGNIEDTIFDEQLPVNSLAVLNRIAEILKEHKTNNVNSTSGDIRLRRAMWLLNEMYYGQTAVIDMSREWQTLYDLKDLLEHKETQMVCPHCGNDSVSYTHLPSPRDS